CGKERSAGHRAEGVADVLTEVHAGWGSRARAGSTAHTTVTRKMITIAHPWACSPGPPAERRSITGCRSAYAQSATAYVRQFPRAKTKQKMAIAPTARSPKP